jgi:hypothetical protein
MLHPPHLPVLWTELRKTSRFDTQTVAPATRKTGQAIYHGAAIPQERQSCTIIPRKATRQIEMIGTVDHCPDPAQTVWTMKTDQNTDIATNARESQPETFHAILIVCVSGTETGIATEIEKEKEIVTVTVTTCRKDFKNLKGLASLAAVRVARITLGYAKGSLQLLWVLLARLLERPSKAPGTKMKKNRKVMGAGSGSTGDDVTNTPLTNQAQTNLPAVWIVTLN